MVKTALRFLPALFALCLSPQAQPQQAAWEQYITAGLTALQQDTDAAAEKQFELSLKEAEKLGPLNVARSLTYLALVYERQSRYAEAEQLQSRALAIREKELGPDHPDVATSLEHHARLLLNLQRTQDVQSERARAQAIRAKYIEENWKEKRPAERLQPGPGRVQSPRPIEKVDPEYSDDARIVRLQGTVELSLEVWPDGRAHNFRLRRGLGLGLDEKAIEAVSQWQFEPALKDDTRVVVQALITIHFRLL